MAAMESRPASLREAGLAPRALHGRPRRGLIERPGSSAVEIVRHADGPVEVRVSGLIDSACAPAFLASHACTRSTRRSANHLL